MGLISNIVDYYRATNFKGAEGIALHKSSVCEAKYAKHKLLTKKKCNKLREPKGKH